MAADPGRIESLLAGLERGAIDPPSLISGYLERIRLVDIETRAWSEVFGDTALAEAEGVMRERPDAGCWRPLRGIPVGIKDIIDVAGHATRGGSATRRDIDPAMVDAEIVTALRAAGAIILGKTNTTEFAHLDPGPTRNPHNLAHTPGGSSSGSAAAVAAGMVPLAIGTQTTGSVIRPAAYCGVAAFKPTIHSKSGFGILPLAPTFDTLGYFGFGIADAVHGFRATSITAAPRAFPASLSVAVICDPILDSADGLTLCKVNEVAARLSALGHQVVRVASPVDFSSIIAVHEIIEAFEVAKLYGWILEGPRTEVGPQLRDAVEAGARVPRRAYLAALEKLAAARAEFWQQTAGIDVFLFPAVPAAAPAGLESTGDGHLIAPWTSLGGPIAALPVGFDANDLPLSLLAAGVPGNDSFFADAVVALFRGIEHPAR
jgi:aspartyl-tRNA(Asn)/glutamyl-tRNA(Gln) amidotransferase subunit A